MGRPHHFALATLLLSIPVLAAQQQVPQQVPRERVISVLDGLGTRIPDISRDIGWLRASAQRAPSLPPEVLQDLEELQRAVDSVDELPEAERAKFVERAKAHLALKAAYCNSHPQGMAAQVELVVHTWAPGSDPAQEAKQWNVVYLSAPMAVFPDRKGRPFPGVSSPVKHLLPPGVYVVWAEDPSDPTRRGPQKEIQVGDPVKPVESMRADVFIAKQ